MREMHTYLLLDFSGCSSSLLASLTTASLSFPFAPRLPCIFFFVCWCFRLLSMVFLSRPLAANLRVDFFAALPMTRCGLKKEIHTVLSPPWPTLRRSGQRRTRSQHTQG